MKKQFLIASLLGATLLGTSPAVTVAAERDRPGQRMSASGGPAPPNLRQARAERQREQPSPRFTAPQGDRRPDRAVRSQPRSDQGWQGTRPASPRADSRPATRPGPNGIRPNEIQGRPEGNRQDNRPNGWVQNRPGQNRPGDARPDTGVNRPDRPDRPQNWSQNRPGNRPDDRNDWRNDRRERDRADWRNDRGNRYAWDTRDRPRAGSHNWAGNWDHDWRRDQRYDWQRYRDRYGDRYRARYHAPRGWSYGYSRFSIGFSLWSGLYSSQYWINDPYYYRLPPAYGSLRWVRYYDDALLVDIRSGQVVDVIYDFFW